MTPHRGRAGPSLELPPIAVVPVRRPHAAAGRGRAGTSTRRDRSGRLRRGPSARVEDQLRRHDRRLPARRSRRVGRPRRGCGAHRPLRRSRHSCRRDRGVEHRCAVLAVCLGGVGIGRYRRRHRQVRCRAFRGGARSARCRPMVLLDGTRPAGLRRAATTDADVDRSPAALDGRNRDLRTPGWPCRGRVERTASYGPPASPNRASAATRSRR
jgi:hypothetical protein